MPQQAPPSLSIKLEKLRENYNKLCSRQSAVETLLNLLSSTVTVA